MTLRRLTWVRHFGRPKLPSPTRAEKQRATIAILHTGYDPSLVSVRGVVFLQRCYRDPRQFVLSL